MTRVKEIPSYEGRYAISDEGEVHSTPKDGKTPRVLRQEKFSLTEEGHSYRRVSLSKEGKVTRFLVHRLVATAFIDNPENKPCVNHIDNNPSNNNSANLEWCTHSENMLHAERQGRLKKTHSIASQAAVKVANAKLNARVDKLIGKDCGMYTVIADAGYIATKAGRLHRQLQAVCKLCRKSIVRRVDGFDGDLRIACSCKYTSIVK